MVSIMASASAAKPPAKTDVAIVGGGPGGLALANALRIQNPDLSFKVFERSGCVLKSGAGVVMYPNGTAALGHIDPAMVDHIRERSFQKVGRTQIAGPDGNVIVTRERDWEALSETGMLLVPWREMTESLYRELPEESVAFGKELTSLALPVPGAAEEGVSLTFQDGDEVQARLVVGCDGLLSDVRRTWLPDDPPPVFNDRVVARGRLPVKDLKALPGFEDADGCMYNIGNGISAFIYSASEDVAVWTFSMTYDKAQELGFDYVPAAERPADSPRRRTQMDPEIKAEQAYQQVVDVMHALPESFQMVVRASDPSSAQVAGEYIRPPDMFPDDNRMGEGPVTVLGDAMHPASVAGQGANLAFEDAAVLSYHLGRVGPTEAALRAYEADRIPRAKVVVGYICEMTDASRNAKNPEEAQQVREKYPEWNPDVHRFEHPCLESAPSVVEA